MKNSDNEKNYWSMMVLGFLTVGLTLSYWTIKADSSLSVDISDINRSQILKKKHNI